MGQLEIALENMKGSIAKSKGKRRNLCEETAGQVSSYLVFLKSTVLSQEAANKLSKCLRERLAHIYASFPQQGIEFAAALCQTVYDTKILPEFTAGNSEQKSLWDKVLNALLSGVLDFYDEKPDAKCKEVIGDALYPTLCSTFFSISISHMSVDLRCTGYSILSETAGSHKANQKRLLDRNILGGERLGSILWRTRDFLVLESILNLFARMLPSTGGTAAGKAARTSFIRSVFVNSSPDCTETGEKLAKLLEKVQTADWDQTAIKILDVLASSNVAFPQPFQVTEVIACGEAKSTDRLFVDERGIVANVLLDEDSCDSLFIPYSIVDNVEVSYSQVTPISGDHTSDPRITLSLKSLPVIGKEPITPRTTDQADNTPTVAFALTRSDILRFQQALKSRGLKSAVKIISGIKSSVLAMPTKLEMDCAGKLVENMELAQRIDNLSQLYGTDDHSDEPLKDLDEALVLPEDPPLAIEQTTIEKLDFSASKSQDDKEAETLGGQGNPSTTASSGADITQLTVLAVPATVSRHPGSTLVDATRPTWHPVTPLQRTESQCLLEAFGASDDELSDIEMLPGSPKRHATALEFNKRRTAVSRFATKACLVVDSDDDLPSTPTRPLVKRVQKKLVIVSDEEDEIEEVLPLSKISSSVISRRRSTLNMAPVALQPLGSTQKIFPEAISTVAADTNPMTLALAKTCDESAALGDNRSVLKTGENHGTLVSPAAPVLDRMSRKRITPTVPDNRGGNIPEVKSSRKTVEPIIEDTIKPRHVSSSPVPLQLERQSVKGALRKRDGAASGDTQPQSQVKKPKRKRSLIPAAGEKEALRDEDELQPTASKRRKGNPGNAASKPAPDPPTEGRVPAGAHAVKRYRGKKGRTSSPETGSHISVNYDRIPDKPPIAGIAFGAQSSLQSKKDATKTSRSLIELETATEHKPRRKPRMVSKVKVDNDATLDPQDTLAEKPQPRASRRLANINKAVPTEVGEVSLPEETREDDIIAAIPSSDPVRQDRDIPAIDTFVPKEQVVASSMTKDVLYASTPKGHLRRKSNKKPWNDVDASESSRLKATVEIAAATDTKQYIAPSENHVVEAALLSIGASSDQFEQMGVIPDRSELDTACASLTIAEPATTLHDHSASNTRRAYPPPALEMVVDMTVDSPVRNAPVPRLVIEAETTSPDRDRSPVDQALPTMPQQGRLKPSVTFALDPLKLDSMAYPSVKPAPTKTIAQGGKARALNYSHKAADSIFNREAIEPTTVPKPRSRSPSMENIASVLNEIQEVLLRKIHSKIEGVREDVRIGRNKLIAEAASDLVHMRDESITGYNLLIELEADYATFGHNVVCGLEDLSQVNCEIEREVKKIIQDHNRSGISKKAPTTLFSASLPASVLAFKT